MRSLLLATVAAGGLTLVANSAIAGHTTRTDAAPVVSKPTGETIGLGFYTCVHIMYQYGKTRYGNSVSDDILFRAAYDVCST